MAEEAGRKGDPLGARWIDGPLFGGARTGEEDAIELFRAATPLPGFSTVSSQRVWRRLSHQGGASRWRRPAVLVGLLLVAGGAAAATLAVIRAFDRVTAASVAPHQVGERRSVPSSPASSSVSSAVLPPPPVVIRATDAPASKTKRSASTMRGGHPRRMHPATSAPTALAEVSGSDEGTLGKETALFREALSKRAARDSRAALAALDRYAALYPRGSYAAEVLVLRGELAADGGDCVVAMASFDRALESPASPGLEERALFGRAGCHDRRGERAAAQADYRGYLDRFPHGRFADHARAALRP